MTADEPRTIAQRIAARLGVAVEQPGGAGGGVLVLGPQELDDLPAEQLRTCAAAVVAGTPGDATSAGLSALAGRVADAGLTVVLQAFATLPGAGGEPLQVPLAVASATDAERLAAMVAAGPHALGFDPAAPVDDLPADAPPARVCVVSFEAAGVTGGGIGTASSALAETLGAAGHDVTLLFTGWQEAVAAPELLRWQERYAERSVRLELLREPGSDRVRNPHFPARVAYEVHCWLSDRPAFDVVHLPENMGHGAYAQLAKAHGAAFARTTFVVGTHGPTRWAAEANRVALSREEFLVKDALERVSVGLADLLLGPSRYLHDYLRARGWALPDRVHVQPYARPGAIRALEAERETGAGDAPATVPDEIVFFGRIETRKGVVTLCDALDLLAADDDLPPFSVTFLGPVSEVAGRRADAYLAERAARWPWEWRIVSDRDQRGAAEYLARPGVLAAMPSTVDNAPNTVSEAIALGIPLVAGATGGTGELIAAEQRDDHMFGADAGMLPVGLDEQNPVPPAEPLAALLRRRLTGAVSPARPPVDPAEVDRVYDRWHRAVAHATRSQAPQADARAAEPLAVCLLHDGDAALLASQLEALHDDENVAELVVADLRADPSVPIAVAADRGVAVVAPAVPGHGAQARAAALAATDAELIAFLPAGFLPLDGFARELGRAAAATGAAVVSCAVLGPEDDDPVTAAVPLPGPALAGLSHPAFAVGPFALRRAALADLGGFAADAAGAEADHELLNRAALAGLPVEVVPAPLARAVRPDRWDPLRGPGLPAEEVMPYDAEQWLRAERPFADAGELTGEVVELLRGAREEAERLRRELADAHAAYEARIADQRAWIDGLERHAEEWRADHARLVAQVEASRVEVERLNALNAELSQSAAQLAMRTLRSVGKRLDRKPRD